MAVWKESLWKNTSASIFRRQLDLHGNLRASENATVQFRISTLAAIAEHLDTCWSWAMVEVPRLEVPSLACWSLLGAAPTGSFPRMLLSWSIGKLCLLPIANQIYLDCDLHLPKENNRITHVSIVSHLPRRVCKATSVSLPPTFRVMSTPSQSQYNFRPQTLALS